jgi:hypothetical protein
MQGGGSSNGLRTLPKLMNRTQQTKPITAGPQTWRDWTNSIDSAQHYQTASLNMYENSKTLDNEHSISQSQREQKQTGQRKKQNSNSKSGIARLKEGGGESGAGVI